MQSLKVEYLNSWGNSGSIALLDPACEMFTHPTIKGVICYRIENHRAVVFGDPITLPENQAPLIEKFHDFCQKSNLKVIYAMVSSTFAQSIKFPTNTIFLHVGNEIVINPMRDLRQETGSNARLLRKKYNHAVREKVVVKEYTECNHEFEKKCEELKNEWLENRKGLQIYLSPINLFADYDNKKWFYAERDGNLIGLLMINRIGGCNGWVQNVLMLKPESPVGSSELLILSALKELATQGCAFYSVGAAPGDTMVIKGMNSLKASLIKGFFTVAKKMFKLTGRQKFWEKFSPTHYPSYVIIPGGRLGIGEIKAIMRAFHSGM